MIIKKNQDPVKVFDLCLFSVLLLVLIKENIKTVQVFNIGLHNLWEIYGKKSIVI